MTNGFEVQRDRVVGVRRRIRASRAFLFRAWTDPVRFVCWFGPKTWSVERCEIDAHPGGTWRAWLTRSDGSSTCVGGVYTEVEPDRRIVFTWENDPQGRPSKTSSIVTVEFLDCPEGVDVHVTHRELTTAQAVDMDVGWNSTLESLEEYVITAGDFNAPAKGERSMSSKYTGGCNCGAIRYEIESEPIMAGHCQCRDCQRMSGTGHASHIGFPLPAVTIHGKATHWEKAADSGNKVTRTFCPTCGSPVYSTNSGMPGFLVVEAASLDDPTRFAPQMVVYTSSGFAWDHLDPALPRFSKMPEMARR